MADQTIGIINPAIAEFLDEWETRRAMINGARVVRAGGEKYLPKFASVDINQHRANRLAAEKAAVESGQALKIGNAAQTASLDHVRRTMVRIILDQIERAAW